MLDRRAIELGTDFRLQGVTVLAFDSLQLELDQFVGCEAAVDFLHHRGGKAFAGDGYDGVQMVGGGAQGTALFGSQFDHVAILAR